MTQTVEATRVESTNLVRMVEQSGLEVESASTLLAAFQPIFDQAEQLRVQANAINVTDATQVTEIKQARALRLQLKEARVKSEHVRKTLKEESLRKGKAIDGIANVIKFLIEPLEERLLQQEQFAERKEAERKAALKSSREELLRPFNVDTSFYQLGEMPEQTFAQLLDSTRLAHDARIEAARKAEAERIAKQQAEKADRARIRAENDRLKKEAEAREAAAIEERRKNEKAVAAAAAKARREREAIEAKAKAEREAAEASAAEERGRLEAVAAKERAAREKLEAQARAAKQAEERRVAAEAAARKRAELAPDKEKLVAFAASLRALAVPVVTSPAAVKLAEEIRGEVEHVAAWVAKSAGELT